MTEKEAIDILKNMEQMECSCSLCQERKPAIELAIKALTYFGCGCGICLTHNNMKCPHPDFKERIQP